MRTIVQTREACVSDQAVRASTLIPPRPGWSTAKVRLYETALVLFAERGYNAVSVRDIVGALGQQPGALYTHVPSKQQLLYDLTYMGSEWLRDGLRATLLDTGREPKEQIYALTHAHVRAHLDRVQFARVTNRDILFLSAEQQQEVIKLRIDSVQLFLDVIDRGVRLGELVAPDPMLSVLAIVSMGVKAADWWIPDGPLDHGDVADTYATFAVKMLTP
jgi:AcrR family transcriptional regulator